MGGTRKSLPIARTGLMLERVSYFERDLVRRMIKQLGEIAQRIAGLARERKFEEALSVVRQSEQELLGPLIATLDAVDAKTVRLLLGNDEKLQVWVVLLSERAKLLDAQGHHAAARSVAARAAELGELLPQGTAQNPPRTG